MGRPVSLGEVFMRTHTRADGSFVDQKSEQVAEAYKKTVEERLAELEEDVQDASEISSEHSMHPRELSIDEMNDIFLKVSNFCLCLDYMIVFVCLEYDSLIR